MVTHTGRALGAKSSLSTQWNGTGTGGQSSACFPNIRGPQIIRSQGAIPCSALAQQRHNIIPNRVALVSEESVSVVTVGTAPTQTGTPPMRIYIIGNDGITLC